MKKKKEEKFEVQEELETPWQVFMRNYKTVPGFKELVKLIAYILFFIIFVATMSIVFANNKDKINRSNTTTTTSQVLKYQDVLGKLLDHSDYTCRIKINNNNYIINGSYGNNILTGTIETAEGIHKFKIAENNIYEVVLDNETLNNELLKDINKNILMNDVIVNILKNNSGTKIDNTYKYSNININDINYNIDVVVNDNKVTNIKVSCDNISYDIVYE